MPKVVHVVTTRAFAGVERYVAGVAVETAARDWDVAVVGGDPSSMENALRGRVRWMCGDSPLTALASLARLGRVDVCHAHMTKAEAATVAGRIFHRAPIVATRHFAQPRGATRLGSALGPFLAKRLACQIAVSEYVAQQLESAPDVTIPNAVSPRPSVWRPESRVVLVLQRLEPEKDTLTALRAWRESRLAEEGWTLRIAGDGSERSELEGWVARNSVGGVEFRGWTADPDSELAEAGMVIAPAAAEPAGVAVLESMSAGIPVVASAAGGHLETIGRVDGVPRFSPGDSSAAAAGLRELLDVSVRSDVSRRVHAAASARLSLAEHVGLLLEEYRKLAAG